MAEQQENENQNAALHQSCDFTMQNFEIRQAGRDQEVSALREAKAILSGADYSLVQRGSHRLRRRVQ